MDCYLAGAETESLKVHSTVHGREHGKTSEFYEDGPNDDALHWLTVEVLEQGQCCVEYCPVVDRNSVAPWMVVLAETLHAGKANLIHSKCLFQWEENSAP